MGLKLPMLGPVVSAEHKLPELHAAEMQLLHSRARVACTSTLSKSRWAIVAARSICSKYLTSLTEVQSLLPCAYVLAPLRRQWLRCKYLIRITRR